MWSLLDTIGASAISGMVVLLVITINLQMNSLSTDIIESTLVQSGMTNATSVLKYDLYKIGYRSTGNKIITADSNQIKYTTDIDNNGVVDTVEYKTILNVSDSTNYLYRVVNSGSNQLLSSIETFNIIYYDSIGSQISYAYLSNQTYKNKVRSLKVEMTVATEISSNTSYQQNDLSTIIKPKNLR